MRRISCETPHRNQDVATIDVLLSGEGAHQHARDRLVPYCMFTDPPLARVGLSEGEAERQGVIARVATLPMDSVLGAQGN
jgi:pyruvate/2-oxoglutarate dehydrogenase complex dihydrolipoamide dehydrogenase (E3) component